MNNKIVKKAQDFASIISAGSFSSFISIALASVFLVSSVSLFSSPALAQTQSNPRGVTAPTASTPLSNARSGFLTEKSVQLNATGSCDSTCDAMGGAAPASSMVASFNTQVVACGSGYSGSKTQTRTQNPDGSFTPWVDADRSLCVCTPTYSDSTQMCASPLAGTYVQRTPWVCSGNVGSTGTPSTVSNSCFTPCAPASPSSQSTSGACPSGYSGTVYYQRDSSCPSGNGTNSSAAWGGWYTTSSSCVLNQPVYHAGHFAVSTWASGSYFGLTNNTGANLSRTSGTYAGYWPAGDTFYTVRGTSSETFTISNGQTLVVYKSGNTFYVAVY